MCYMWWDGIPLLMRSKDMRLGYGVGFTYVYPRRPCNNFAYRTYIHTHDFYCRTHVKFSQLLRIVCFFGRGRVFGFEFTPACQELACCFDGTKSSIVDENVCRKLPTCTETSENINLSVERCCIKRTKRVWQSWNLLPRLRPWMIHIHSCYFLKASFVCVAPNQIDGTFNNNTWEPIFEF